MQDSFKKIYFNFDEKQLKYSDGGEEEKKLIKIAALDIGLSRFTDERLIKINFWSTESKKSHLLAGQLDIMPRDSLLELAASFKLTHLWLTEIGHNF